MHAVKYAKGKSNIHNSSPHAKFVEISFGVMVKLGTRSEGRHDPQLSKIETREQDEYLVNSKSAFETVRKNDTHYDVAQQQKHTDFLQHTSLPQQFGFVLSRVAVLVVCCQYWAGNSVLL